MKSNGNKKVTVKKHPNIKHLYQYSKTGNVQEYKEIEETINPEVLQDITDWILEVTK